MFAFFPLPHSSLFSFQEIRKHLKTKRPFQTVEDEDEYGDVEDRSGDNDDDDHVPENAIECRCNADGK